MTKAERARENFLDGWNCAQAVALAFAEETGLDKETLSRLALPLGGGVGRLREICGAFTGAAMCLGLLYPEEGKDEIYARVQKLYASFTEKTGSGICFELLSHAGLSPERGGISEPRTEEFYKSRPCPALVALAADLLATMQNEDSRDRPNASG